MEEPKNENIMQMMEDAFNGIRTAHALLSSPNLKSRENSLTLTKLEEGMMWLNKDRTIKGFLPVNETHVA